MSEFHIMLIGFLPNTCPVCGKAFNWKAPFAESEFWRGVEQECTCGLQFKFIDSTPLKEVMTMKS